MLPLDTSSLYSLVAIAVLSYLLGYLLGYLAAQLQFPDRPSGDAHPFDHTKIELRADACYWRGDRSVSFF